MRTTLTTRIKESLTNEGFSLTGIARAEPHPDDAAIIDGWTAKGMNGSMAYLEKNRDKRADITLLVPGARSVIVAALNYYNEDLPPTSDRYFISRYARGKDYHDLIRSKLYNTVKIIREAYPDSQCRVFCDSAPLTEKAWAQRAGIGWRGRNSLIINRSLGSFFLLGEIVTDAELEYDEPITEDFCGECRKCIEGCPTGAINYDHTIDARKCISYHTIELRGETPPYIMDGMTETMIFGCDRCQEICPWNKKATRHHVREFEPSEEMLLLKRDDWHNMTEERFKRLFAGTPLERAGYNGLMHNIALAREQGTT